MPFADRWDRKMEQAENEARRAKDAVKPTDPMWYEGWVKDQTVGESARRRYFRRQADEIAKDLSVPRDPEDVRWEKQDENL